MCQCVLPEIIFVFSFSTLSVCVTLTIPALTHLPTYFSHKHYQSNYIILITNTIISLILYMEFTNTDEFVMSLLLLLSFFPFSLSLFPLFAFLLSFLGFLYVVVFSPHSLDNLGSSNHLGQFLSALLGFQSGLFLLLYDYIVFQLQDL